MRVTGIFEVEKVEKRGDYSVLWLKDVERHLCVCAFDKETDYSLFTGRVCTCLFDIYFSKKHKINTYRFVGISGSGV